MFFFGLSKFYHKINSPSAYTGDWQPSFGVGAPHASLPSEPPRFDASRASGPPVAPPQRYMPGTRKRKLCVHHASGNCRYGR